MVEVFVERAAGLDVHKRTVVATVHTPEVQETRTDGTMTKELHELGRWLEALDVTHVAMESTGPYWKPVYNILEKFGFELLVCNAQPVKAVPGRKADDVHDAAWLCDLLRHGLLRPRFVPSRELRELVRDRRTLIRERARELSRIQKVLEGANIKLASVATDGLGVSGRRILEAMVAGVEDPKALAGLAKERLRSKQADLERALVGRVGAHQRLLLREMLGHVDELDARIERLSREIEERMRPFTEELERLDTIPGIARRGAEEVIAEIGVDMDRFPSAAHLASWAGVCPGHDESGGKRRSGRTRKGNPWLRAARVEAAHAAARTRGSDLKAQYHRIAARRGRKRAAVAVVHTILDAIDHMLKRKTVWQDLGSDDSDRRNREAVVRRLAKRIEALGYKVAVEAVA